MNTSTEPAILVRDRMSVPKAAAYLGIAKGTLDKMRASGRGPRFIRLGSRVFYRKGDLDAYLQANVVETADSRATA
ncbi:MAG TPA: helix-turn-helix domain-containing protein [Stenotrophomonas sp.]|nr:helix-turn-helix domain-containing protein [Stenotrophomonas sp.]